jgi:hypothetical protein
VRYMVGIGGVFVRWCIVVNCYEGFYSVDIIVVSSWLREGTGIASGDPLVKAVYDCISVANSIGKVWCVEWGIGSGGGRGELFFCCGRGCFRDICDN